MLYPISYLDSFDREDFTNPFRYAPHPLVQAAAAEVLSRLETWKKGLDGSSEKELERSFAEGKMLGVLICRPKEAADNKLFYIAGFSGTVRGKNGRVTSTVDGFVPPIIDLTSPDGYFKQKEAEISQINQQISDFSSSVVLKDLKESLKKYRLQQESEIEEKQRQILISKKKREEVRKNTTDASTLAELIKESQFQKAELKRLKDRWKDILGKVSSEIAQFEDEITTLKKKRAQMSDDLQKWIFESAAVHNASGEVSSIWNIFTDKGLVPPGGTGDCAAPKLLEYVFCNGLWPLAMGEFWYGRSPETAVRTHGHFYPSCTSKCGPLLGYMMQGLNVHDTVPTALHAANDIHNLAQLPVMIYEDESIIVVEKPSGMPSVPGLDGRISLLEWLENHLTDISDKSTTADDQKSLVHSVHRLDMDTSGVIVYAKTEVAAINLRKQFEEHTVRKTYIARLSSNTETPETAKQRVESRNATGTIELPLSPDYDERPRQKVDFKQGKPAHTDYKIVQTNPDGTTDILLYPLTGRTHQLRVHCAHTLGLASPIVGDLLYGSHTANCFQGMPWECQSQHQSGDLSRLCLHALSITFTHPLTGAPQTFTSDSLSFQ